MGCGGVAELAAELDDDLIERAGRAVVSVSPDLVEEVIAGEDLAGARMEELQQLQFPRGEFTGGAVATELERARVDGGFGDVKGRVCGCRGCTHRRLRARAAQERLDARHQFADTEGLRDVIVGPDLEPDDLVEVLTLGGEHEDRGLASASAQLPTDVVAAEAGQHDIEEDEIRILPCAEVDREVAAGAREDLEAFPGKDLAEAEGDVGVILDDQDALGGGLHGFRERVGYGHAAG